MRKFVLLAVVALAACAVGPSRSEVLAGLVGRPESDALRTLGAPNRAIEANGHRFLVYDDGRLDYVPAPGFGFGFGYYPATIAFPRSCETTVEVTGGVVRSWTLRGNDC